MGNRRSRGRSTANDRRRSTNRSSPLNGRLVRPARISTDSSERALQKSPERIGLPIRPDLRSFLRGREFKAEGRPARRDGCPTADPFLVRTR